MRSTFYPSGQSVAVLAGVKIELIDDVQKTRPAQNLLRNALHALLQVVAHVGRDVIFGHGWLFYQNQCSLTGNVSGSTQLTAHTNAQPINSGIRKWRWRRPPLPGNTRD